MEFHWGRGVEGKPFLKCSIFRGLFTAFLWIQAGPWKDWPFSELTGRDMF